MADLYLRTREKKPASKPEKKVEKKIAKKLKRKTVKKSPSAYSESRKEIYRLIGKSNNHFSSFVARPKKLDFETRQKKRRGYFIA